MSLEGMVALVTGGGRGIGAATALRLAREGAAVAVSDLDLEPAQEVAGQVQAAGGTALALACDVRFPQEVNRMFQETAEKLGRLDILVTSAGVLRDNLVHKMSEEDWDLVIDTHLKGSFLCCQAAQRLMVPQRSGKMVLISSTSALGNRGQANYSAAKMGIQGLARTLAIELGRYNINVNVVAPGFIETRMTMQTAERLGVDFEGFKEAAAAATPIPRVGVPDDIAGTIAFLVSPDASYISGQTVYVRGGP